MRFIRVYDKGGLIKEVPYEKWNPFDGLANLPDSAYIELPIESPIQTRWYRSDFTPVLLADVPKEYLAISLILGN